MRILTGGWVRRAVVAAIGSLAMLAAQDARATFIGDLVYCDANANGVRDAGEVGLNGVGVRVVCTADNGVQCADLSTVTGTLHPTAQATLGDYTRLCGTATTWDPTNPAEDLTGRYLVEVFGTCGAQPRPWTCSVTVDGATAPATCNQAVTPVAGGFPIDDNGDGDLCDAGDGPFPEAQPLGNIADDLGCEAYPDPPPASGRYTAIIEPDFNDGCSIHNDFGFTNEPRELPTRTPGFWKNHPAATAQFLPVEFCGEAVTDVCAAVALLGANGGGLDAFKRHATAAQLNCAAFGCPADVQAVIDAGNAACDGGGAFGFGAAADELDFYNNSGDDLASGLAPGPADPKFCSAPKAAKKGR